MIDDMLLRGRMYHFHSAINTVI